MTPLGEFLRRERQERGQLLGHMAKELGMSSPYLSQIETGKRTIPDGFEAKVARVLNLSASERNELERAAALSRTEYQIEMDRDASVADRALAFDLMTSFARLSPAEKQSIHNIVRGKNNA